MNFEERENLMILELPSKMVTLKLHDFDTDIDVDELTKIHFHNIMGEILTCSVAMNRIGNLLAEFDEVVKIAKLDLEIYEAQRDEEIRKELVKEGERATNEKVQMTIIRSPEWKIKKTKIIKLEKELAHINSLYWSIKSKDEKLNKLTDKLRPEDFESEIVEGKINGIMIKISKKAIK